MAEARAATFLDFSIAASGAVLPILLIVLYTVSAFHPADPIERPDSDNIDRYVNVRLIAALKTFEYAVVRRDRVGAGAISAGALIAGIPECSSEWGSASGSAPWHRLIVMSSIASPSPAQRLAVQINAIDRALARFSARANRRVDAVVGFDAARWFEAAARALRTPVEVSGYPGVQFHVRCRDLATAAGLLARADARLLDGLHWRGSELPQTIAQWRPDQWVEVPPTQFSRSNPWGAEPMRVRFGSGEPVAVGEPGMDTPPDDARWQVPPSLPAMLQGMVPARRPIGAGDRDVTGLRVGTMHADQAAAGHSAALMNGAPLPGFAVDLTIAPAVQALAQKTVACYTGRQDVCRALGLTRREDAGQPVGHQMLEHAVVRMAAVAIIDVESGRIEALAGALSPCTRNEYDGPGRGDGCDPRLPYRLRYRPDALLNPAVFHDAMPASTIKPVMAAGFLSDPAQGSRWLAAEQAESRQPISPSPGSLRGQLMRSDSAGFLDRLFCAEHGFKNCDRLPGVMAAALAAGWNSGCARPDTDCGKRDLLSGRAPAATGAPGDWPMLLIPYGRLLAEPASPGLGAPFRTIRAVPIAPELLQRCASGPDGRRPSADDWTKCRGGHGVDVVAEAWGQGHARASALGVAGMMASLAAAANEQAAIHRPHLIEALRELPPRPDSAQAPRAWHPAEPEPNRLPPAVARVILSGLSYSHRAGTARPACEQVFAAHACQDIDWIAGKTGTTTFPGDEIGLDELQRICGPDSGARGPTNPACGALRPYKWYVAAYRGDASDLRWTKAIAVLTERNWLAASGRIHGAGDHGPNPAAEIALQIVGRQAGRLSGRGK